MVFPFQEKDYAYFVTFNLFIYSKLRYNRGNGKVTELGQSDGPKSAGKTQIVGGFLMVEARWRKWACGFVVSVRASVGTSDLALEMRALNRVNICVA